MSRVVKWTATIGALLGLALWLFSQAARYLEGPAEPPSPADFQVVLGGDVGDRVAEARREYAKGLGPYIVLTGMEGSPMEARGVYLNWRAQFLVDRGVPLDRIIYDTASGNSWDEAVNTRTLMRSRGWHSVLVISDPYHMRRLQWIWSRVFEGTGLQYSLVATSPENWQPDRWWRHEKSAAAVIMEYIKILYYAVKYRDAAVQ